MNQSFEKDLGEWLIKMSQFHKENGWGFDGYDAECWNLVCQILQHADNEGFLLEAYNWMNSSDGWAFFERDGEFGLAANMVLIKTHELGDIQDEVEKKYEDPDDDKLIDSIRKFYSSNIGEITYAI